MGRQCQDDQTAQWGEWPGDEQHHCRDEWIWWHGECDSNCPALVLFLFCCLNWVFMCCSLKTGEEMREMMKGSSVLTLKNGKPIQKREITVPKFLDWRTKGYVAPVRRQVWQHHLTSSSTTGMEQVIDMPILFDFCNLSATGTVITILSLVTNVSWLSQWMSNPYIMP